MENEHGTKAEQSQSHQIKAEREGRDRDKEMLNIHMNINFCFSRAIPKWNYHMFTYWTSFIRLKEAETARNGK